MTDDEQARAQPRPREASEQSAAVQGALLAALNVTGAWAEPLVTVHAVASVFQSAVIGVMKLDAARIPWVLALVDQVNAHVAEAVAALTSSDTKN